MATTRRTPTLAEFKQRAADIAPAARAVCLAHAFEQVERERVAAYVRPIFESYHFTYGAILPEKQGQPIPDPDHLYLCDDSPMLAAFYEDCDAAHRAHGFDGPHGHCPALRAQRLAREAEDAFIDLTTDLFGVKGADLFGDMRKQFLDCLLGAALQADKDQGGRR